MAHLPDLPMQKNDYETLAEFRYALRKFLGFSEDAARRHGVSPQQYQALLAIEGHPGRNWMTVGELAERMCIAHQSSVGLINRLEAMQLAQRSASREDRRRVRVSLTAKGRHLLAKLYEVHRNELRASGPHLASLLQRAAARLPARAVYASPACAMPEIED